MLGSSGIAGLSVHCVQGLQQLIEEVTGLVVITECEPGPSEGGIHSKTLAQGTHLGDEGSYLAMLVLHALAQYTRSLLEVWLACSACMPSTAVYTIILLNIEPLGSEFVGRNTWKPQSNLGYLPHK
jgi:hypothetical protein